MNTKKILLSALISIPIQLFLAVPSLADELRIPVGMQGTADIEIPKRGQKSDDVKVTFGEPDRSTHIAAAIPISTWHYEDFSVYFESDRVIHSVRRH